MCCVHKPTQCLCGVSFILDVILPQHEAGRCRQSCGTQQSKVRRMKLAGAIIRDKGSMSFIRPVELAIQHRSFYDASFVLTTCRRHGDGDDGGARRRRYHATSENVSSSSLYTYFGAVAIMPVVLCSIQVSAVHAIADERSIVTTIHHRSPRGS